MRYGLISRKPRVKSILPKMCLKRRVHFLQVPYTHYIQSNGCTCVVLQLKITAQSCSLFSILEDCMSM